MAKVYRVLVVDDEDDHLLLIKGAFLGDSRKWHVSTCQTMQQAKVMLFDEDVDLVIADWNLPDGDSLMFLKEFPVEKRDYPIVVMTSYGDESVVVDVMKAGALDYCVKSDRLFQAMPLIAFRSIREWSHVLEKRKALLDLKRSFESEKKLRMEADAMRVKAENANEAKNRFLAIMSHEFRTPLLPIMGYVKMIKSRIADDEVQAMLDVIGNSAEDLSSLISDIIDVVELESGNLMQKRESCSVADLQDDVKRLFLRKATDKGLTLELPELKDASLDSVFCDKVMMCRAIYYVVDNAVKFTESGSVTVEFSVSTDMHNSSLNVKVHDSGIGIAREKRDMIYDVFSQVDYTFTRTLGGAGVGLALCKQIVDRLGGTISFESELDSGTCFTLAFPVRSSRAESPIKGRSEEVEVNVKSILLAEDDITNRMLLEAFLGYYCEDLYVAENGTKALQLCKEHRPSVIVTDYHMPGLNGLELIERTRHIDPSVYHPKTIMFTADARRDLSDTCRLAGIDDFLEKPFGMNKLGELLLGYGFKKKQRITKSPS